jgi:hypothetical protein
MRGRLVGPRKKFVCPVAVAPAPASAPVKPTTPVKLKKRR